MLRKPNLLNMMKASTKVVINQYNFYVDFKGLLFFDDGTPFMYPNCIKDVKFISYLYKNLQPTQKKEYSHEAEFWGQKNYVRSAISPVIFNWIDQNKNLRFSVDQKCEFKPDQLELDSEGRIWHPYRDQIKGVFSNDLIAHVLQQVQTKDAKSYFKLDNKKYEIKHI